MKKETNIKKFLLGLCLLVLLLPLLQEKLSLFWEKPLKGSITPAEKPVFSKTDWFNGIYQDGYERWYNENFGFRNTLIRLHNQVGYDLYNVAYANGVVIGKDDYLYEENYILDYTGQNYLGDEELNKTADKLKAIQDSLEKKGVTLLVCLAPGKASFYPEFIPDKYGKGADKTNYKMMASLLNQKNINNIDFNKYFMQWKKTSPYPLYPKTGIHWSRYAITHTLDSLVRWIEAKRHIDMPNLVFDGTYTDDSLHSPDEDVGNAMNLLWNIPPVKMGYQKFHYEDTTGKAKISLMAISDSFFWEWYDSDPTPSPFTGIDFYYYDRQVYRRDGSEMTSAMPEQSLDDAKKNNVVVIMCTEANLFGMGWGFIDDAYNGLVLHKSVQSEDQWVHYYEGAIRLDQVWLGAVKKKAVDAKIPLDSMIHLDAVYMAKQKMQGEAK